MSFLKEMFQDHSKGAVSLVEVVVGGALLLVAALVMTTVRTESNIMDSRLDLQVLMRRAMDRTALEISRNGGAYPPQPKEAEEKFIYYACYAKNGVMAENDTGNVEFGLKRFVLEDSVKEEFYKNGESGAPPSAELLKEHKFGLDVDGSGSVTAPCRNHHFVVFVYPLSVSGKKENMVNNYNVYLWSFGIKARKGKNRSMPTLASSVTRAPVF